MNSPEFVITKFGGLRKAARAIGIDPASVSRWRKNKIIPLRNTQKIINALKRNRIKYTVAQLTIGH